jgi:hypothetical protein
MLAVFSSVNLTTSVDTFGIFFRLESGDQQHVESCS